MVRYLVLILGMSSFAACNFTWEPSPGFEDPALEPGLDSGIGNGGGMGGAESGGGGAAAAPDALDGGLDFESPESPDASVDLDGDARTQSPPCHDAGPLPDGGVDAGSDDAGVSCDLGVECADGGGDACAPVVDGAASPLDAR